MGRNCTLFEKTRKWAYRAIRQGWPEYEQWLQACYERACAYNLQFNTPLDENEVMGISKRISKWTNKRLSEKSFNDYVKATHSSKVQVARGVLVAKLVVVVGVRHKTIVRIKVSHGPN